MSFWTDLSAAIGTEIKAVEAKLADIAKFLKPIVEASATEIGAVAVQAVMQQAPLVISGQEKFVNAVASVKTSIAATGKTAALNVIEAATQQAYDALSQAAHPAAPAVPPPA